MFDLAADDGSVRKRRDNRTVLNEAGDPTTYADPRPLTTAKALESVKMDKLFRRLLSTYLHELERQQPNRYEQAVDEDMYDNIQWRDEDAAALEARGQMPLVYNVIAASIDWVLGTERRSRADYKVLPRRKADGKQAERKSQLLKYLQDVNHSQFHVSDAFADAVKAGVGWIEDGWGEGDDEEPIYRGYENWRNMLWDSAALKRDVKDGRYMFRSKWVDLDITQAMFPARAALLQRSVNDANIFAAGIGEYGDQAMDQAEDALNQAGHTIGTTSADGYKRERLRMIEAWIRMPVQAGVLSGGSFNGELFDAYSPGHIDALNSGESEFRMRTMMRMFVGIFTECGLVYFGPSPYRHNRFPFTPIWGKRRGRDRMPYGMIRGIKGMQEDINKRASKALHILSTNKVIIDEDTIPAGTTQEEFYEEAQRPDALIVKTRGSTLDLDAGKDLAQWQLEMMSRSIQMIQSTSGVTDELLGRETQAKSGIAIQRRQDQGSMATSGYFDNLRFALQISGEKQLSLCEQFMGERKTFRITNTRGAPDYIDINDGLPENDIVRSKADFIISEADWRATQRQAQVDQLLETLTKFPPEVSLVMLDLIVEDMDIAHRDELVKRIRALTGQRDPDAEEMTPEEQDQAKAKAERDAMQKALIEANVREAIAKANLTEAQSKDVIDRMRQNGIDALLKALNAGAQAIQMPAAAHVADHILTQTGNVPADPVAEPIGLPPPDTMPPAPPPQDGTIGIPA